MAGGSAQQPSSMEFVRRCEVSMRTNIRNQVLDQERRSLTLEADALLRDQACAHKFVPFLFHVTSPAQAPTLHRADNVYVPSLARRIKLLMFLRSGLAQPDMITTMSPLAVSLVAVALLSCREKVGFVVS